VSVQFFGQFLIERGEIDAEQLRRGLDLMKAENRSLGQVAVQEGILSPEDAERVNAEQRSRDLPFGVLAVELGLLSEEQLDQVLAQQAKTRLFIGEALARLGSLPIDRLPSLLDEFKAEQAPYQVGEVRLPESLSLNRLAGIAVDYLPKFAMRVSSLGLKLGAAHPLQSTPDFEYKVGLQISGAPGLQITLMGDRKFARQLAAGTFGTSVSELGDDLIADGMGEFLNILAGNAVAILEREGIESSLEPPDYRAEVCEGCVFEVVVTEGQAGLVLSEV
jgi:hypothetical protein